MFHVEITIFNKNVILEIPRNSENAVLMSASNVLHGMF